MHSQSQPCESPVLSVPNLQGRALTRSCLEGCLHTFRLGLVTRQPLQASWVLESSIFGRYSWREYKRSCWHWWEWIDSSLKLQLWEGGKREALQVSLPLESFLEQHLSAAYIYMFTESQDDRIAVNNVKSVWSDKLGKFIWSTPEFKATSQTRKWRPLNRSVIVYV